MMTNHSLDLAGIGIGPFNLSLAAHLDAVEGVEALFFERRNAFDWHPGMMLPDVTLQTSFLKDLVSATHPSSPWTFLSFLVAKKRFYDFMNADFAAIPRREFAQYLSWAAQGLPTLRFGAGIDAVDFDGRNFVLRSGNREQRARNIALGVGLKPALPAFASRLREDDHFHSSQARFRLGACAGKRVAVIGGGQSGAEILLHLLNQTDNAPSHVAWISQRPNFLPLDETPFTNELFTPPYVASFRDLPEPRRHATVEREKLAGDGVSSETLTAIYRRLYVLRHLEPSGPAVELLPHRDVVNAEPREGGYQLIMRNGMDGMMEIGHAEIVILATGYRYELPDCLAPLTGRIVIDRTGRPVPDADFAIAWDGPNANRIFALNAGLISHGIAEPQLSLMAWRGAVIANALLGRRQFDVEVPKPMVNWRSQMHTDARLDTVRSNGRLFSP